MRKISGMNKRGGTFWNTPGMYLVEGQNAFAQLWKDPVYPILFITVDQILHLAFLWPVVLLIIL